MLGNKSTQYLFVIGLILLGIGGSAQAQQRTWLKSHMTLTHSDTQALLGEYTLIQTFDSSFPSISRTLYHDPETESLFVIRHSIEQSGAFTVSVEKVGGTELFTAEFDGTDLKFSIESEETEFDGDEEGTTTTRALCSTLLQTTTTEFRDDLERVAEIGAGLDYMTDFLGSLLTKNFYPNLQVTAPPARRSPSAVIQNFDPNVHSPSTFDQQFGSAYFQ